MKKKFVLEIFWEIDFKILKIRIEKKSGKSRNLPRYKINNAIGKII